MSYYTDTFSTALSREWTGREFALKTEEISLLSYYRALTCFIEEDKENVELRRKLLYNFMKRNFKSDAKDLSLLEKYKDILPIDSSVGKLVGEICTSYINEPKRNIENDKIRELYSDLNINDTMLKAHRLAYFVGLVGIAPILINNKITLKISTPDKFLVKTTVDNQIDSVTYPSFDHEENQNVYHVWTKSEYKKKTSDGKTLEEHANEYGIIPIVFLKINKSNKFYSGGKLAFLESQIKSNKSLFYADSDIDFNRPWKIARNIDRLEVVSPDRLVHIKDSRKSDRGQIDSPTLESFEPKMMFKELAQFSVNSNEQNLINEGIPASIATNDESSTSGIARVVERQSLLKLRDEHNDILAEFERELSKLIMIFAEKNNILSAKLIDFSIDFEEERIYLEPETELEFDKSKLKDGLLNPLDYVTKWGNFDKRLTEPEAIQRIQENKELLIRLGLVTDTETTENKIEDEESKIKDIITT